MNNAFFTPQKTLWSKIGPNFSYLLHPFHPVMYFFGFFITNEGLLTSGFSGQLFEKIVCLRTFLAALCTARPSVSWSKPWNFVLVRIVLVHMMSSRCVVMVHQGCRCCCPGRIRNSGCSHSAVRICCLVVSSCSKHASKRIHFIELSNSRRRVCDFFFVLDLLSNKNSANSQHSCWIHKCIVNRLLTLICTSIVLGKYNNILIRKQCCCCSWRFAFLSLFLSLSPTFDFLHFKATVTTCEAVSFSRHLPENFPRWNWYTTSKSH